MLHIFHRKYLEHWHVILGRAEKHVRVCCSWWNRDCSNLINSQRWQVLSSIYWMIIHPQMVEFAQIHPKSNEILLISSVIGHFSIGLRDYSNFVSIRVKPCKNLRPYMYQHLRSFLMAISARFRTNPISISWAARWLGGVSIFGLRGTCKEVDETAFPNFHVVNHNYTKTDITIVMSIYNRVDPFHT